MVAFKRKRAYSKAGRSMKKAKANPAKPRLRLLRSKFSSAKTLSQRVVLKYQESGVNLDPGIGTVAAYVYSANGLYDPNITGVGHQPTGFDQYMALFNGYVVLGATIKITAQNSDTTYAQHVGISVLDLPTTSLDERVYIENGNTTWTTLGVRNSGNDIKTLTYQVDIQKWMGEDPLSHDQYQGNSSANPAEDVYFHIWAVDATASVNSSAVQVAVEISFDVLFRNPSLTPIS